MKKNIIVASVILALGLIILITSLQAALGRRQEQDTDPSQPSSSATTEATGSENNQSKPSDPKPSDPSAPTSAPTAESTAPTAKPSDPTVESTAPTTVPTEPTTAPTETESTEPKPTEPKPTETEPTEPKPTEPKPTEPKPTEPKPTEPKPTEPKPTEPKPTEPKPTEPKPTEPKPTEPKPTEPKPTEPKPTDPPATEPKPTQPAITWEKVSETVYATGTVNVRSGPGTSYDKLGQLSKDQAVKRVAIGSNGWSKIEYNGKEAYVSSTYLTQQEPVKPTEPKPTEPKPTETKPTQSDIAQEGDQLEDILKPGQITLLRPVASGVLTKTTKYATIDYSNTKDGYVMVKYLEDTDLRLKVRVVGPTTTYTYNIEVGEWNVFPLSDGNGEYQIKVLRNKEGTTYSNVTSITITVNLDDEFAPYLRPNQYVNYEYATNTMQTASIVVAGKTDPLDKVEAIFNYVVNTLSYDTYKAATVESGYLPDLDQVLAAKKGICFDYAALMAAMLRSQNIPCKLVVGFAGDTYHAWISVWSADQGWVEGAIYFDGADWQLMDPTFASTTGNPATAGIVYTTKYIY